MGLGAVESKPGLAGTRLRLRITDFNFCPAPCSSLRNLCGVYTMRSSYKLVLKTILKTVFRTICRTISTSKRYYKPVSQTILKTIAEIGSLNMFNFFTRLQDDRTV